MAHGLGRLIHADGDCYEGEWFEVLIYNCKKFS